MAGRTAAGAPGAAVRVIRPALAALALALPLVLDGGGADHATAQGRVPGGVAYALADTWQDERHAPEAGRYEFIWDVSSAPDGSVYVLDRWQRVHVLAGDLAPRRVVALAGDSLAAELYAEALDVGFDGTVYVLAGSGFSHLVLRLRPDVDTIEILPIEPPGDDATATYTDLAAGPDGRLYLSRQGWEPGSLTRVEVWSPDGEIEAWLDPPELGQPGALDVAADGTVYVAHHPFGYGSSSGPPGPVPTPLPSLRRVDGVDQTGLEAPGIAIFGPDHRYRRTVPFANADDVAVGPAGVFVARDVEVYALGEREPLYSGPAAPLAEMRLDVPVDGRLLASLWHCAFQGLLAFDRPADRPAAPRLAGALDQPALEGPPYPMRLAASDEVAILLGRVDRYADPPDVHYSAGQFAELPQAVQRWTRAGQPAGRRRLRSQLGLCGASGWFGDDRTVDVASDGSDVYTISRAVVERRPDDLLPAWTLVADAFTGFAVPVLPIGVSADGGRVAVLGAGDEHVYVLDAAGALLDGWPVAAPGTGAVAVDLALDAARGRVYVADSGGGRILVRALDGRDLGAWRTHDGPARVAVGPGGDVFVLGRGRWAFRYRPDGTLVTAWPMPDRSVDATDIGVDADGRVYVPFVEPEDVVDFAGYAWGFMIERAGVWVFEPTPAPPVPEVPPPDPGRCLAVPDKRAAPGRIPLGATVGVTLAVDGHCPARAAPAQIALVFDTSRSMSFDGALDRAKDAAVALVGALDATGVEMALVTFDDGGALEEPLTADLARVRSAIAGQTALGDSRLAAGLALARAELTGPRSDPAARRAIVVVTDGVFTDAPEAEADAARAAGLALYVLLAWNHAWDEVMSDQLERWEGLLGDHRHIFHVADSLFVGRVAARVVDAAVEDGLFEHVTIVDEIPANMRYVEGSAAPPAQHDPARRSLTWRLGATSAAEGVRLRYRLEPLDVGTWPTNVRATGDYRDAVGMPGRVVFPVPTVEVFAGAHRAFLPIASSLACARRERPVDVVLVVDTSSSMAEPAPGGGTKLDAAREAAGALVASMAWPGDQVAVVAFDQTARTTVRLSGDRPAVEAALATLAPAAGTRIDLGLAEAAAVLAADRRDGAQPTVILLSDGLQHQAEAPNGAVVAQADGLKRAGALVYTIGLGDDVDRALLEIVATDPGRMYVSPTADDLGAIYAAISARLACER